MPASDMTEQMNTPLAPDEEAQFQAWAQGLGRGRDLFDYDLRGYWKDEIQKKPADEQLDYNRIAEAHLPDKYKKPNHPTFSNESQFHGKPQGDMGLSNYEGGSWHRNKQGTWEFRPARTNLEHYSPQELQTYFNQFEPDSSLVFEGY